MTNFFDSVNIDEGDFNLPGWVGAVGAARFKEDDQGYLKVSYFIDKKALRSYPHGRAKCRNDRRLLRSATLSLKM